MREHFGWSQETLAYYLNVSRSLVKLAEAGQRSLPLAADAKLGNLQLYKLGKDAEGKPLPPAAPPPLPAKSNHKKLLRQARQYSLLAEKADQQLADAQRRYEQAQRSLAIHQYLQPLVATAAGDTGERDRIWLDEIALHARKVLKCFGPDVLATLQWKRDCYRYAAERAKALAR